VVKLAQRNSSSVRIAEADVSKARAQLAESRDVLIPTIELGTGVPVFPEVGFTGTPPSIWDATVQSLVFGVPQKRYIDAARLGLEAAMASLHAAKEQVALDASTTYIELDTVNRELKATQQQEGDANKLVAIEQQRTMAGVDPLSDLLEAKLTAAQIRLNMLHLETRATTLSKQLSVQTGLPSGTISPDRASIPQIPPVSGDLTVGKHPPAAPGSAELLALSKQETAKGDAEVSYLPQLVFQAQYLRNTTLLNTVNDFFKKPLPANNFASGISIQIPVFDMLHRARARASAAEALRATVEAQEAQRQHEVRIATLTSSLRELSTEAEIARLKEEISAQKLKSVLTQLQMGSGAGAQTQLSPKAAELARIDKWTKYEDSLEANLNLNKARLDLLHALGDMQEWMNELHTP
jgi:outer membrane protein TolC